MVRRFPSVFVFLFEVLSHSTIKGYRPAISKTISITGGLDLGNNEFLFLLVRNFSLGENSQRILVSQWDLVIVLEAIQLSLFELVDVKLFHS